MIPRHTIVWIIEQFQPIPSSVNPSSRDFDMYVHVFDETLNTSFKHTMQLQAMGYSVINEMAVWAISYQYAVINRVCDQCFYRALYVAEKDKKWAVCQVCQSPIHRLENNAKFFPNQNISAGTGHYIKRFCESTIENDGRCPEDEFQPNIVIAFAKSCLQKSCDNLGYCGDYETPLAPLGGNLIGVDGFFDPNCEGCTKWWYIKSKFMEAYAEKIYFIAERMKIKCYVLEDLLEGRNTEVKYHIVPYSGQQKESQGVEKQNGE